MRKLKLALAIVLLFSALNTVSFAQASPTAKSLKNLAVTKAHG